MISSTIDAVDALIMLESVPVSPWGPALDDPAFFADAFTVEVGLDTVDRLGVVGPKDSLDSTNDSLACKLLDK
jgi:hypothetical protein